MLENELCRKEYAIAKRHPLIGQQIQMPSCIELPPIGSDLDVDCLSLELPKTEPVNSGTFFAQQL